MQSVQASVNSLFGPYLAIYYYYVSKALRDPTTLLVFLVKQGAVLVERPVVNDQMGLFYVFNSFESRKDIQQAEQPIVHIQPGKSHGMVVVEQIGLTLLPIQPMNILVFLTGKDRLIVRAVDSTPSIVGHGVTIGMRVNLSAVKMSNVWRVVLYQLILLSLVRKFPVYGQIQPAKLVLNLHKNLLPLPQYYRRPWVHGYLDLLPLLLYLALVPKHLRFGVRVWKHLGLYFYSRDFDESSRTIAYLRILRNVLHLDRELGY